ncbi:hypothetical protein O3G_MSEX005564 [Manduca sexta]|uniref:Luciferin 4-monooxygenase n=1 Tax=Manduca sexta TaxID=7130 RepID=A0A922CIX3_MANSE|nr:hypothetical protein O3G_MSEX005564 [Manduca sexta]
MVKKRDINKRATFLKLKAAQRLNIAPEKCHIGHILLQGMLEDPNSLNQIDGATDARETNISVAMRSCRLASAMVNSGMEPGDPVIITGRNHLDLAIPFYACHFNGYPLCGIDPMITAADMNALFPYIKPKMIFCEQENVQKVKDALASIRCKAQIVVFDDSTCDLEYYIKEKNGTERNYRPAEFDHSKITAWLMLTSGTTGQPKVAIIPFDTLLNGVCCWWTPFTDVFETTLVMANLQWMSALMFFVTGSVLGYTRLQTSVPLTPQILVMLINKYRPNVTAWTPYLLGQFLVAAENVCDLSSFRYIAIGGSAIEKPLYERFSKKCGAFLYLVYGMTELLVPVFDFDENTPFGSTGIPSTKYQFKLIDNDNQIVDQPLKTGELWIKGDAFFKGYLNNAEETKTILTDDGWFKTGDMFYRDEQNLYYFVERKRLLIKHFGFLIAPLQLEEVIKRHPGVLEACVVGVPDPECMELPIAAILKKNGMKVDPQEIFDLLKKELPDLKQLRGGLFFVDSFPVTPSGKVHRAKVKEMALITPRIMPVKSEVKH